MLPPWSWQSRPIQNCRDGGGRPVYWMVMLSRIMEPELMLDADQAEAYAKADFSEPHQRYVELCQSCFAADAVEGWVLDLGCGPGDITFRFARAFPKARLVGVDGSAAMLQWAVKAL